MVKERRDELNYQNHSPVGVFISIETITKENKHKELLKGSSEIELFMLSSSVCVSGYVYQSKKSDCTKKSSFKKRKDKRNVILNM